MTSSKSHPSNMYASLDRWVQVADSECNDTTCMCAICQVWASDTWLINCHIRACQPLLADMTEQVLATWQSKCWWHDSASAGDMTVQVLVTWQCKCLWHDSASACDMSEQVLLFTLVSAVHTHAITQWLPLPTVECMQLLILAQTHMPLLVYK